MGHFKKSNFLLTMDVITGILGGKGMDVIDRNIVTGSLEVLDEVVNELKHAWSNGDPNSIKHLIVHIRRVLNNVDRITKDDLWKALPESSERQEPEKLENGIKFGIEL